MYYLSFILLLFLSSCQTNYNSMYYEAEKHRESEEYKESSVLLYKIIESTDTSDELKFKAHFLLADIYLNLQDFELSIESYKNILSATIENKMRKKALFMIAYIYNNNLDMYSHSREYYELFKSQYSNDDLIPSVDYELEQIEAIIKNSK